MKNASMPLSSTAARAPIDALTESPSCQRPCLARERPSPFAPCGGPRCHPPARPRCREPAAPPATAADVAQRKEPGRASCNAQPGFQPAINKPARSSHERDTPTPLLDHRKHTGDERESARARGGVDFGDMDPLELCRKRIHRPRKVARCQAIPAQMRDNEPLGKRKTDENPSRTSNRKRFGATGESARCND